MASYRLTARLVDAAQAHAVLAGLDRYYPGFDEWYVNKVIPGITLRGDPLLLAEDAGQIVGMAVGRTGPRPKVRCIRVIPAYAGRGLALHLMDRLLHRLGCDQPQLTVAEELLHDWARILVNRYGFQLSWTHKGRYRPGRLEYEFNGATPPALAVTPY